MTPYLPSKEPNIERREKQLEKSRKNYHFNYEYLAPLPYLDKLPRIEKFSIRYWLKRSWSLADMPLKLLFAYFRYFIKKPIDSLSKYLNLFPGSRISVDLDNWLVDEEFNEQRLSGCNPQAIERLDALPDNFVFTDQHIQALLGIDASLAGECSSKRLYYADYHEIAHVKGGVWKGMKRTIPSPRALFWWNEAEERLQCVGIQIRRTDNARVYLPSDPHLDWLIAKIAYQCADANHQELGTHFTWCHAVMAPFAIVTNRQLALNHPLHILLKPHFLFYLHDNELGRTAFLNPGGPVERMMGSTLAESLGIAANLYKEWNLMEASLPKDLAKRKMDDPGILPNYPYRDDGILVWDAVVSFVTGYITLYYKNEDDIVSDKELQAWAKELASQSGGRVVGMPSKIKSIEELIEIVSIVVWTCGPLHSMLNFSQWDYNYTPNMPYAIYAEIPEERGSVDYETIIKIMPPFREATYQLLWNKILTSYHHNPFGHYPGDFDDKDVLKIIEVFQKKLTVIEQHIISRDNSRRNSSPYFMPSRAINSINT